MKNLTIIAAIGKNRELGKNNDLIWHLKEDMKFFKNNTTGKPIVMGMKTLESLPKLLPNRKHIVLTRQDRELDDAITVFHSVNDFLEWAEDYQDEIMIIGGASIYGQMLDYTDKMLLTEIEASAPADAFFPSFNKDEWNSEILSTHEENNVRYKHLVYTRKR